MMYRKFILLSTLVWIGNNACSRLDNIDVTEVSTATIQGANIVDQLTGDLGFSGFSSFDISNNQSFKNQGVSKSDIDSAKIKSFTLQVTSPDNQDITFIESITFFVETSGQPKQQFATGGPFSSGATTVSLTVNGNLELKPYVTAESMTITTEVSGNKPSQDTTIQATLVFDIDINVL